MPEAAWQAPAAIILAAGRGERMRPLTDACPKPLLPVRGQPLMQWHARALAAAGVRRIVINTGWLGGQIRQWAREWTQAPGGAGGIQWPPGLPAWPELILSEEERDFGHTLETAGGIARALPRLAASSPDVFWAVAGDIHAPQFPFAAQDAARFAASGLLAHLWLVPNPPHHPAGDFALAPGGLLQAEGARPTFSAIALYRRPGQRPALHRRMGRRGHAPAPGRAQCVSARRLRPCLAARRAGMR